MKSVCLLLLIFSSALSGCGGGSEGEQPPRPAAAVSRFIHTPAVSRLDPTQLRALSMDCEKYAPDGTSRGPYDIAYCENAIAAWGDSPLQMLTIPQTVATAPNPVARDTPPANSAQSP